MVKKDTIEESILCIAAGILFAIWFMALMCGEGDKGILDLFF